MKHSKDSNEMAAEKENRRAFIWWSKPEAGWIHSGHLCSNKLNFRAECFSCSIGSPSGRSVTSFDLLLFLDLFILGGGNGPLCPFMQHPLSFKHLLWNKSLLTCTLSCLFLECTCKLFSSIKAWFGQYFFERVPLNEVLHKFSCESNKCQIRINPDYVLK